MIYNQWKEIFWGWIVLVKKYTEVLASQFFHSKIFDSKFSDSKFFDSELYFLSVLALDTFSSWSEF